MRATFGLVLVAGIAGAIGLSLLMRDHPEDSDAPATRPAANPPLVAKDTPVPIRSEDPSPKPEPQSSAASRAAELLGKNDFDGAARILLAASAEDLKSAAVRERVLRTAEGLLSSAEGAPDAAGTRARMDARRLYAMIYTCESAKPDETQRAFDACAKLHRVLLFGNGAPDELVFRHRVQSGESVWALAKGAWKQRGVTVPAGFVLHVNSVADARRVRAGQLLRVPLERMRILVRKSRFELTVLLGGAPVERFSVAIGADTSTPAGVFAVSDRIKEPDWYFHGKRIPYGAPENIIGSRWIGLGGAAAADGIGIHGTSDDASIGKAVSMGCVRMHNADVERLFDWLDAGVEVEIRD